MFSTSKLLTIFAFILTVLAIFAIIGGGHVDQNTEGLLTVFALTLLVILYFVVIWPEE